jgi:hypothetical protein
MAVQHQFQRYGDKQALEISLTCGIFMDGLDPESDPADDFC